MGEIRAVLLTDAPVPPIERPRYDRDVGAARTALDDPEAFDEAWRRGRALSLEEAMAFALEGYEAREQPVH